MVQVFSEGPNGENKVLIGRCDRYSGIVTTDGGLYLTNWLPDNTVGGFAQRVVGGDRDMKMLLGLVAALVKRQGGGVAIDGFESASLPALADKLVITQMNDPFAVKLVVEDL
jgi:hypothetical protein